MCFYLIFCFHKQFFNHYLKRHGQDQGIADSLYTSKIRYGVQLLGNVRTKKEETEQKLMGTIQVAQNKLARFLNGNSLMDKVPTTQKYKELNIQSVNQLNAQIKLLDVWKSTQSEYHSTKWARRNDSNLEQQTRSAVINNLSEAYGGRILTTTFVNDAAKTMEHCPRMYKKLCVS